MSNIADFTNIAKLDPLTGRTGRRAYVVDPEGLIRCVPVTPRSGASAGSGGIVNETPGRNGAGRFIVGLQIDAHHARLGWRFYEEICAEDPDHEIREEAYKLYVEWCNAGRRSARVAPLGEEWYPDEVLRRRAKAAKAATVGLYEAPTRKTKRTMPDLEDKPRRRRRKHDGETHETQEPAPGDA